jgi:hypothetical protein
MTPARFRWGILFILFGTLILLGRLDVIDYDYWLEFASLIPFLFIAIGIEKIFTRTRFEAISYLSSVVLLAGGVWVAVGSGTGSRGSYFEAQTIEQEADSDISLLEASVNLGDEDLTIRDATDELVFGKFREWSEKPRYEYTLRGDTALVTFDYRSRRGFGNIIKVDLEQPDDWRLYFSRIIPLVLRCNGDEATIHLNLSTTPLRELDLAADNSDIYVKLGALERTVKVKVTGKDSELLLRVPGEAGLRVFGFDDAGYLEEVGLSRRDGFFANDGYDSLKSQIDVDLDDRFQSLSIDYY